MTDRPDPANAPDLAGAPDPVKPAASRDVRGTGGTGGTGDAGDAGDTGDAGSKRSATRGFRNKMIALAVGVGAVGLLYWRYGRYLSLDYLARQEAQLRAFQQDSPGLVLGAAFLVYVLVTGLSLPGAALMSLAIGWYFGFWQGLVLVSFASTSGATVAFLLSRYLFRETIERRFGRRLKSFDDSLEREGPFFLFTLRLIPAVPFFVINAVMGLTRIRTWTFWWVSQLGMLPGTVVYIFAGSRVPDLRTLSEQGVRAVFTPAQLTQLTVAFVLLGLFPLASRWLLKWLRPAAAAESEKLAAKSEVGQRDQDDQRRGANET